MLGETRGCSFGGIYQHPGCIMKTKAAETADLIPWIRSLLRDYDVPCCQELIAASTSLSSWLDLVSVSDFLLSIDEQQRMCDHMQRHLANCERAMISFAPKHHFFAHMSSAVGFNGNPRFYSTFLDESLNLLLRNVAAFAHRSRQAYRIISMMHLIGRLRLTPFVFGSSD